MELANLKVVNDRPITQTGAPAPIEGLIAKSDEHIPVSILVRKGLHLDVDEILRHSLPNVSQPTVSRRDNWRNNFAHLFSRGSSLA
jgi:hypothetical protein